MTKFKTQEAIGYIRGILKSFRYTVPAAFMDDVERAVNKWDEELITVSTKGRKGGEP